jgi:hypothetical protein
MATKANPTYMVTGKVRASYFFGIVPAKDTDDNGNEVIKFRTQILIDKTDKETLLKIKACIAATMKDPKAIQKWGGSVPAKMKTPLRDGDTETNEDGEPLPKDIYGGKWFMNVGTTDKPGILGPNGEPPYLLDDEGHPLRDNVHGGLKYDPQFIVSGDYVRVSLKFYGYKNKGNKGVTAGLNNIQLLKKGEQIGGKRRAEDDFADGFVDDDDPENDPIGANAAFDDDDPLKALLG